MAIDKKNSNQFFADMLDSLRQGSRLSVSEGSEPALRLMALAAQLEALCREALWVYRQAFPQTADDENLDRHAELRGITRRPATVARGTVRFFTDGSANVVVPKGTVCLSASLDRYITTDEVLIAAGDTSGDAPVDAEKSGEGGNIGPGGITAMTIAPMGVSGCTNPAAVFGGTPAEGDDALRERVVLGYRSLPNGANAAYYEAEATTINGVAAAKTIARPRGAGTVDVCIASAAGVPSTELIEAVFNHLQTRREIAVDLCVIAPRTKAVNVNVKIMPADGVTFDEAEQAVRGALLSYFNGTLLARPLYASTFVKLMLDTGSVKNVKMTAPSADIAAESDLLPVVGNINVSELV